MNTRLVLSAFNCVLSFAAATTLAHAGPATHFSVSAVTPVTSNETNGSGVTVTALDASNNTDTAYAGTVHLTSTDPTFLNATGDATLSNGMGSFNFGMRTAGVQTITATDTVNSSITGTSNDITVNPGPTYRFILSLPAAADPGVAFNFTVSAADLFGNITSAYSGTVHFNSSDGAATLPADSVLTNGQGTFSATFQAHNLDESITATDTINADITGTGSLTTTPVELQNFGVE